MNLTLQIRQLHKEEEETFDPEVQKDIREEISSLIDDRPEYYCPECKQYCKDIIEVYDDVFEYRTWTGDCYELCDSDLDDSLVKTICYECYRKYHKEVTVIDSDEIDEQKMDSKLWKTVDEANSIGLDVGFYPEDM